MNLSALFIKRPDHDDADHARASWCSACMSYRLLPVSDLPTVDFPTIQVSASLPGASPETMASAVALPLEKQFATIAGLDSINSTSSQGSTNITLQFDLSRNIDAAAQDVQAMIAQRGAPAAAADAGAAVVPEGQPGRSAGHVPRRCARRRCRSRRSTSTRESTIAQRISMVSGVAQVQVFGAAKYAVRVDVDPRKLAARGIGIDEVAGAISERERQPADRHDVRRATRPSPSWPTVSCCARPRTAR